MAAMNSRDGTARAEASPAPAAGPDDNSSDLRLVLIAGSIIAAIGLGVRSTFGLFLNDINGALGTDTATFALAIGIQNLIWGIGQPVAGAIADRFGSARVLIAGAFVYCAGVLLMANATSAADLYLSGGFIVGVGLAATSFSVVLASIGRRFPPERRTKALGIATAVGSGGQFVFVQLANRIDAISGWQAALTTLGLATLLIAVLAAPLRGNSESATSAGEASTDGQDSESLTSAVRRAAANPSYLLLCAGFFVCGFHVTFIATHFIPYLENNAVPATVASLAWALVGLTNIAGSYLAGVLGARYRKTYLLAGIYAARGVAITAFVLLPLNSTTVIAFGAIMGLLWLSTVPLTGAIVTQQFGTRFAGTLFGIVFLAHQLGAFAGAYGGGWLADRSGSYLLSWWIAVALAVGAMIVHLFIDEGPQPMQPTNRSQRRLGRVLRPALGLNVVALFALLTLSTPATSRVPSMPTPVICGGPHPLTGTDSP